MRRFAGPLIHLGIVLAIAGAGLGLMAATPPDAGANIGAGMVLILLIPFGLPWNLHAVIDPYAYDGWAGGGAVVVYMSAALFNVVVHLALLAWLRNRASGR